MSYQWAAGHDNEAGYQDIPGRPTTRGIQYPVYVTALDGTVHPKGAPFVIYDFNNVETADYISMLTALGFSGDPDDVSAPVTLAVPEYDYTTFNDWNATCVHRPGVDTEWDGTKYPRVHFVFKQLEAT
jgi:hypothetical protein